MYVIIQNHAIFKGYLYADILPKNKTGFTVFLVKLLACLFTFTCVEIHQQETGIYYLRNI